VARRAVQNSDMSETIWLPSLVLALHQNRHAPYSRYVQMATVRANGRPANRTLVFRGFLHDSPRLTFVTDERTAKVGDLERLPWAEICWYFPVTHEQFRISGPTTLVRDGTGEPALQLDRRDSWRELAEAVRVNFTWPAPGEPREEGVPFPTAHTDPETPPAHFCLLVLDPHEVDLLEINGNPQNRWVYRLNETGRWSGVEVNP
jgi:pyridoxamine 5'-phosphate oxidase